MTNARIVRSASLLPVLIALISLLVPEGEVGAQASLDRAGRVQWLQTNAAPIRSIDPADDNFEDLAALGAAIGDSRVVMLGEQSHGDGAVFLAKTRMIRYLHEKLGFDVLAFESGLYDVPKAWGFLKSGEDANQAVKRGVFGIWMGSKQLDPLIAYIGQQAKSPRPLELTGFDNQFTASASRDFFEKDLRAFLRQSQIDTAGIQEWTPLSKQLNALVKGQWLGSKPNAREYAAFMDSWRGLRQRVGAISSPDTTVRYWRQVLKSVEAYAQQMYEYDPNPVGRAASSVRDLQMGENLVWLANEVYPNRKIIVWAATFHIIRNPQSVNTGSVQGISYQGITTMGHVVSRDLGKQAYAIGFVASQGTVGNWRSAPYDLRPPAPESLEDLFSKTRHENAFVDFRALNAEGAWLRTRMISGPLGYAQFTADWTRVLDGMVYTRKMTPSRPR